MISLLEPNKSMSFAEISALSKPDFTDDLQLDYLIDKIVAFRENPELRPYFYLFPEEPDTCFYRQEVFRDLQSAEIKECMEKLIAGISCAERYFQYSDSFSFSAQKWKWRLDGILVYYQTIEDLCTGFNENPPKAQALYRLHQYLYEILCDPEAQKLRAKANSLNEEFAAMSYRIIINKDRAVFTFHGDETDYCFPVRNAFMHGQADEAPVYFDGSPFSSSMELNPLEEFVLRQFQKKNRVLFRDLETFCGIKRDVISEEIPDIIREVKFYLAVSDYFSRLSEKGYPFAIPQIVAERELYLDDCYDIALAIHHAEQKKEVIFNDITKTEFETAILVTGPNQGGKTTLAKAFGQAFYLGMMGFSVPGRLAKLPFVNRIFTLFSSENVRMNVDSRLQTELKNIRSMLDDISEYSVVIMNELFTSAPTMDALAMSRALLKKLIHEKKSICFCVTHTYELAADSDDYVSLVATVVEDGTFRRTFRIIRKEASGIAYANSIVDKYKLNYSHINYRIQKNES